MITNKINKPNIKIKFIAKIIKLIIINLIAKIIINKLIKI